LPYSLISQRKEQRERGEEREKGGREKGETARRYWTPFFLKAEPKRKGGGGKKRKGGKGETESGSDRTGR